MAKKKNTKVVINPMDYPIADGYPKDRVVFTGVKKGKIIACANNVDGYDYAENEDGTYTEYDSDTTRDLTEAEKEKVYKIEKLF